ncbi:MAG TPA: response regulator [Terrimicrobiaceae bacterium]|nr:response regulator [Terrimicrobiaceae bacterium]
MRILIAEDDPAFRRFLKEILVNWGYEVVVAEDGNEAWQALKSRDAPRLAILDWMMPEISGVEICRKVRQELQKPYTYIILLTALQQEQDLVTGMEAGADDYIIKPIKTNELRVRLNAGRRIIDLQNEVATHVAELEVANKDLESFSYTVSTDLLKSLMSIGDNAHAIREMICNKQDEQCISYARRIYEKTKHLGELIGVMHDFFRPTRSELHRETIDLSKMAGDTAKKLQRTKPDRRVKFRITEGIMANGDRGLLQVVLHNLLDNAWKHTVEREEAVIEFGAKEFAGRQACFVRDNGVGFDLADAGKLFKPFQLLPGTEEFAGKGIGLATVDRIVRRHGGKIWAEGVPGQGACFWFTLS